MIEVDGSHGEGGGQILRTALTLAMCTQQAIRVSAIRANRAKRGLMRQHLTAVKAAAKICAAEVEGAEVGAETISFRPGPIASGDYTFDIGTAGSCTLVLQTVLQALLMANGPSTVRITGGTHNKGAPPVDFLQRAYLPLLRQIGADVRIDLRRYGFYPRGGGEVCVAIAPVSTWTPLRLIERGVRQDAYAEAYVASIPLHVAERELDTVRKLLNWSPEQLHVRGLRNDMGPGNALVVTLVHEHVSEVFTGFGELGVMAESIAKSVCAKVRDYLSAPIAVGEQLADQLLLPLALGRGGEFTTSKPSRHFESNVYVIERMMPVRIRTHKETDDVYRVNVQS